MNLERSNVERWSHAAFPFDISDGLVRACRFGCGAFAAIAIRLLCFQFLVIKFLRVYCQNDEKKFHYRKLVCIILKGVYAISSQYDNNSSCKKKTTDTWTKNAAFNHLHNCIILSRIFFSVCLSRSRVHFVSVALRFPKGTRKYETFPLENWVRLCEYLLFGREQIQILSIITGNLIAEQ